MNSQKKTFVATVLKAKMKNGVVVVVERTVKDETFKKYMRKRTKIMAHDEKGAKPGDKVEITESRPLSRCKKFVVTNILQKAAVEE